MGMALRDWGRAEEALRSFSQAIERDPEFVNAIHLRSFLYFNTGRHALAVKDSTRPRASGSVGGIGRSAVSRPSPSTVCPPLPCLGHCCLSTLSIWRSTALADRLPIKHISHSKNSTVN